MKCSEFQLHIDEFLDKTLEHALHDSMHQHQAQCSACHASMVEAKRIQKLLRDLPVPEPRAGFHDRVLAGAAGKNRDKQHRGFLSGFASALAAGLMIWIAVGLFHSDKNIPNADDAIPSLSIALNSTRNVKVTFNSVQALPGATISLILPDSIELAGYSGQRELTWKTDLVPGSNRLRLPISAVKAVDGQLLVKIQHQDKSKTMRINLKITQPNAANTAPKSQLKPELTQIRTYVIGA